MRVSELLVTRIWHHVDIFNWIYITTHTEIPLVINMISLTCICEGMLAFFFRSFYSLIIDVAREMLKCVSVIYKMINPVCQTLYDVNKYFFFPQRRIFLFATHEWPPLGVQIVGCMERISHGNEVNIISSFNKGRDTMYHASYVAVNNQYLVL